jgi:hypothetical protein
VCHIEKQFADIMAKQLAELRSGDKCTSPHIYGLPPPSGITDGGRYRSLYQKIQVTICIQDSGFAGHRRGLGCAASLLDLWCTKPRGGIL